VRRWCCRPVGGPMAASRQAADPDWLRAAAGIPRIPAGRVGLSFAATSPIWCGKSPAARPARCGSRLPGRPDVLSEPRRAARPGLKRLDYLREAIDEGRRCGVRTVVYMNPNFLFNDHPLQRECALRGPDGQIVAQSVYGQQFTARPFMPASTIPAIASSARRVARDFCGVSADVCTWTGCRRTSVSARIAGAVSPNVRRRCRREAGPLPGGSVCWARWRATRRYWPARPGGAAPDGAVDQSLAEVTGLMTRTVKAASRTPPRSTTAIQAG